MNLAGRTVLVTGATSGIGLATARALAPQVGTLLVHGPRPVDQVAGVLDDLRARLGEDGILEYFQADYGRLADVDRMAGEILDTADRIDVVINNAGQAGAPTRVVTADGNEQTLQVDYLAHVALTTRLLDRLAGQDRARIVNVASTTHLSARLDLDDVDLHHGYSPNTAYARAKLALVTYTCWLADRTPHRGIEVVALHPGVFATRVLYGSFPGGGEPPEEAARTMVEIAGRSHDNGTYYHETRAAEPNPEARDPRLQRWLHDLTVARLTRAGLDAGGAGGGGGGGEPGGGAGQP